MWFVGSGWLNCEYLFSFLLLRIRVCYVRHNWFLTILHSSAAFMECVLPYFFYVKLSFLSLLFIVLLRKFSPVLVWLTWIALICAFFELLLFLPPFEKIIFLFIEFLVDLLLGLEIDHSMLSWHLELLIFLMFLPWCFCMWVGIFSCTAFSIDSLLCIFGHLNYDMLCRDSFLAITIKEL